MAGQKFRSVHAPAAFALQLQNPQRLFSSRHDYAGFIRRQYLPCPARLFDNLGFPDFQQLRLQINFQKRERARPRREGAQAVPDFQRGQVPVNLAVLLFYFRGVTKTFGGLRLRRDFSGDVGWNRLDQQFRAEPGQPVVQNLRVVRRENRRAARGQDRPGVQSRVYFHDRHAGFRVAVGNRPLDWRGSAMSRQQRSVDIEAAETRQIQNVLRQNLSVGDDDHQIRLQFAEFAKEFFIARPDWLQHRQF